MTLDNWQSAAHLHWTFQHIADFLPTAIDLAWHRARGRLLRRTGRPLADISALRPDQRQGAPPVGDVMAATAPTAGSSPEHGKVLAEHYYGGMDPRHLAPADVGEQVAGRHGGRRAWSATARSTSTRQLTTYVPALAQRGYAGATVRHLLDMRSGIAFSEDYLDPMAEVRLLEQAIGWAPRTLPDLPTTMYDFLLTLQQKSSRTADRSSTGPARPTCWAGSARRPAGCGCPS